eukprot:2062859-Rhodomonas_salina.1
MSKCILSRAAGSCVLVPGTPCSHQTGCQSSGCAACSRDAGIQKDQANRQRNKQPDTRWSESEAYESAVTWEGSSGPLAVTGPSEAGAGSGCGGTLPSPGREGQGFVSVGHPEQRCKQNRGRATLSTEACGVVASDPRARWC